MPKLKVETGAIVQAIDPLRVTKDCARTMLGVVLAGPAADSAQQQWCLVEWTGIDTPEAVLASNLRALDIETIRDLLAAVKRNGT